MAKAAGITDDKFKQLKADLAKVQPKKIYTAETVVDGAYDEIIHMLNGGYTHDEVIEKLSKYGVILKASSFKAYLRAAKAKREPQKKPE